MVYEKKDTERNWHKPAVRSSRGEEAQNDRNQGQQHGSSPNSRVASPISPPMKWGEQAVNDGETPRQSLDGKTAIRKSRKLGNRLSQTVPTKPKDAGNHPNVDRQIYQQHQEYGRELEHIVG